MSQTKRTSDFAALERKQLDIQLRNTGLTSIETPRNGWIKTIRQALGMTATQLAKRLRITPQSVLDLEKREVAGTITIATLQKAARALDCHLLVALVPHQGLEKAVEQQAMTKAREERNQIVHTMGLEAQGKGVRETLDLERIAESWRTKRRTRLWDEVSRDDEK